MKRLAPLCLLPVVFFACSCSSKSKPNPAIATEVEQGFKQRWIAKRMGELQTSGVTDPREARRQAVEEFKQRYEFTSAAHKTDPVGSPSLP